MTSKAQNTRKAAGTNESSCNYKTSYQYTGNMMLLPPDEISGSQSVVLMKAGA